MSSLRFSLAAVTVLSALTAAAPAEAQRYRHRDRDNTGTAIAAGIAGVVIGAAIASSSRDRYYDRGYRGYDRYDGYYRQRGYYPRESYYYRDYERRGWRGCRWTARLWRAAPTWTSPC